MFTELPLSVVLPVLNILRFPSEPLIKEVAVSPNTNSDADSIKFVPSNETRLPPPVPNRKSPLPVT